MAGTAESMPSGLPIISIPQTKGKPRLEDDELIRIIEADNNGSVFKKLMAGEWDGIAETESEARFALLQLIAWYADSRRQVLSIFNKSEIWIKAVEKGEWPK